MPWIAPTVNDFFARFPSFRDNVEEDTVQVFLDEATGRVGETWIEKDRTLGVLLLAAHLMASEGVGVSVGGGGGSSPVAGPGIKRRKVGDVETEYFSESSGSGSTGKTDLYASTVYGQRYLELLRKNFPAIAVV